MTRAPKLRTRLLGSLVLVAVVVLTIAGGVTYLFVRGTAERAALDDLRSKAPTVQTDVARLAVALRRATNASDARRAAALRVTLTAGALRQIRATLRLSETRLVFVDEQGGVASIDALGPLGTLLAGASSENADLFALPNGMDAAALQPQRIRAGATVTGRRGGLAFLAEPLIAAPGQLRTPVLVLSEPVPTDLPARALPAFLLAATAALLVCIALSLWLARRLIRPLAAVESTARVLASGDLSARVSLDDRTEGEIAEVANALNVMASQLEAARGSERAFLLSVSHDLRTPLTSIRGYAEALADGTLDGEDPEARRRAAVVIMSESRRLERLVRDLLDLSRLDSHQFSLHPRAVDAGIVVRDAVEAFRPHADELGIALTVADDGATSLPADLDPERLGQIVANLVENALKYARAAVDVVVTGGPATVTVTVGDDGRGVPPDAGDRVFERLYTGRDGPARAIGTGLGLAIVRELAVAMGGTAHVDPAAAGARFVVTVRSGPVGQ
ncbi:MAG: two-component system, OmpR family, sensor kinase [Actinomycetota bacterium]|jgi:two-component system sensor histidine kinase BaeS|nr:two-component system, OmpR family, sensor kinase [Actinomycetota bacterium]